MDPFGFSPYSDCVDRKKKEYANPGQYKKDGGEWQGGLCPAEAYDRAVEDCIGQSSDVELDNAIGMEDDMVRPSGPAHKEKERREKKRKEDEEKQKSQAEETLRLLQNAPKSLPAPPPPSNDAGTNNPQTPPNTPNPMGDPWDALSSGNQLVDRLKDLAPMPPGAELLNIDPNAIETIFKKLPARNDALDEAMYGTGR